MDTLYIYQNICASSSIQISRFRHLILDSCMYAQENKGMAIQYSQKVSSVKQFL